MHSQGELYRAEIGAEMTPGARHLLDEKGADLGGQPGQRGRIQMLEVGGAADRLPQAHRVSPHARQRLTDGPGAQSTAASEGEGSYAFDVMGHRERIEC